MSKRFIFLGIGFLILTCLVGVFGIIYFEGDNDRATEESASPTNIPLQASTAPPVPVDNDSSADLVTDVPSLIPPTATAGVVATPVNMRTATSIAYQTQIPLTLTALHESQTATRSALEYMATGTAEAINDTSTTSPTENP